MLEQEGAEVCRMLLEQGGHFYVCGDCKMAEDVWQKLKGIFMKHASMTDEQALSFLMSLLVRILNYNLFYYQLFFHKNYRDFVIPDGHSVRTIHC